MRKFKILDIKLVDFDTFESYDGAEEFEKEFQQYAKDKFTYKFYSDAEVDKAEKLLGQLNLHYNKFYGSEVESDEEIKEHPAFFISFRSDYNLVVKKGDDLLIDSKKMGKRNFQKDLTEDVWIFTKKGIDFFKKEVPEIRFEKILDVTKKKEYYKVRFPELGFPIIYINAINIKENEKVKGRYSYYSDGRTDLDEEAKTEIKKHKLSLSTTFKSGDKIYPNVYNLIIISGDFAFKLKQNFNFQTNDIIITPIYF